MPGSQVTDDVVVESDGTAELRYDVSAVSVDDSAPNGGALYEALTVAVKPRGSWPAHDPTAELALVYEQD